MLGPICRHCLFTFHSSSGAPRADAPAGCRNRSERRRSAWSCSRRSAALSGGAPHSCGPDCRNEHGRSAWRPLRDGTRRGRFGTNHQGCGLGRSPACNAKVRGSLRRRETGMESHHRTILTSASERVLRFRPASTPGKHSFFCSVVKLPRIGMFRTSTICRFRSGAWPQTSFPEKRSFCVKAICRRRCERQWPFREFSPRGMERPCAERWWPGEQPSNRRGKRHGRRCHHRSDSACGSGRREISSTLSRTSCVSL